MCSTRTAVFYALGLLVLAILARVGLADRDAVAVMMLVIPVLAVLSIYRRRGARCA